MKRAFTLMEVLVVVGVIVILAVIAVPNMLSMKMDGNDLTAKGIVSQIATACEGYAFSNNGIYPQDLNNLAPKFLNEPYTICTSSDCSFYGYLFTAQLTTDGYTIEGKPAVCGVTGRFDYKADTHAVFTANPCAPSGSGGSGGAEPGGGSGQATFQPRGRF